MQHPYRQIAIVAPDDRGACDESVFSLVSLAIMWVGSIARVVVGLAHRESFGRELVLACVLSLAMPFALRTVCTRRERGAAFDLTES